MGAGDDPVSAGAIAASFGTWGYSTGLVSEARAWIDAALVNLTSAAHAPIAARLWLALGTLTSGARHVEVCERAAAVFREAGDLRRLSASLVRLGGGYCQVAQYARADVILDEARAVLRACGVPLSRVPFRLGQRHELPDGLVLADSYHVSRYNTNTGLLTEAMFDAVVRDIAGLLQAAR